MGRVPSTLVEELLVLLCLCLVLRLLVRPVLTAERLIDAYADEVSNASLFRNKLTIRQRYVILAIVFLFHLVSRNILLNIIDVRVEA